MALGNLDEIYRDDVILDHRRNPRNPVRLNEPDIVADGVNPFCGDEIHLQIRLDYEGRVSEVGFQG
ncbi:MAG: SUF system NifU family Fe-S cluster assembly protein, partial [Dehalococcoidia bacterium]|nr:SUF system NifU family Fe-S cluster assembly protein [Dehalococcoidia bacterium]